MLDKLKDSVLNDRDARTLHLQPILASDTQHLNGLPVYRAGFRIPYFNLQGRESKFYRFRYLEYGEAEGGFQALVAGVAKQLRYAQPGNSVNELYLPPFVDWELIAADPEIPIIITEGELKSACATRHGLPTIGLGGVWCFKSSGHSMPLLPGFQWFKWQGRNVYILYDSDASINPQVVRAENALAREFMNKLGAQPYIVRLPNLMPIKTGLDDYIKARGIDALKNEVLIDAVEYAPYQELMRLNEEVIYVEDPGLIVRSDTMQRISCRAFVDHAFSTRVYYEQTQNAEGGVRVQEKSAPKEWLKWNYRSTVRHITYMPGSERIVDGTKLNCWAGWGLQPAMTSSPSTMRLWHELMNWLFRDVDAKNKRWFEQWLAYPLQKPGCKLYSAAVLWGIHHGTGKSLVGYTMFRIYGDNATEIGDKDLYSAHNEWAENKQFVMADEITGGDKRATADRMKSMITQKLIRINPKYVPSYTVPDCINYYFTSNHPDAFFLEDDDRRFFVHEVRGLPRDDVFYKQYMKWLDQDGGAAALFHYLLHLDVSDFNPSAHAPVTQSKKDMIDAGRSDLGSWVQRVKADPDKVLKLGNKVMTFELFTSDQLKALYDPEGRSKVTGNGMSRELKRAGFQQLVPCRSNLIGSVRLWCIRGDPERYRKMNGIQLANAYDKEHSHVEEKPKAKFAGQGGKK